MKRFLTLFSFLFHPIVIPLLTTLIYFYITFQYFDSIELSTIIGQITIMTILIPITVYKLLQSLGKIRSSVMLHSREERALPFAINIVLLLLLKYYVLYNNSAYTLNLYFNGLIVSYTLLLIGSLIKHKYSVHATLLLSSITFIIFLMIANQSNNIVLLNTLLLITGITLSSRLYLQAHTSKEIIIGILIGGLPQAIMWLNI
ncbi:MAG: hypothetical protein LBI72_12105 [Flavobacteriaceae bacterium]|jgi:hypothetical protein|nr:hypothetical protein [Flavobacteriaceae bacterium]